MADLISQTFEIGTDSYGRRVTITRHRDIRDNVVWRIESGGISHRDSGELIEGLSDDNIRQVGQALGVVLPTTP